MTPKLTARWSAYLMRSQGRLKASTCDQAHSLLPGSVRWVYPKVLDVTAPPLRSDTACCLKVIDRNISHFLKSNQRSQIPFVQPSYHEVENTDA